MPGMPYHLEKGPVLSVLEDVLRGPTAQVENILTRLRDPAVPLAEVGGLDSTTLNAPPYPTTADRVAHIEKDWFGYVVGTQQQAPFNPLTNPTTGFWENYWGDVAGIVRETLTRAVEVALGLDHDAEPPGTRHWPIELFWKCPNPWFEGWVTWRHEPAQPASGQVTVILATPGNGAVVLDDPRQGRTPSVGPVAPTGNQGMWVVTHAGHRPYVVLTTVTTAPGHIPIPTLGTLFAGLTPVVTVAPSFIDGGASPNGLAYVP